MSHYHKEFCKPVECRMSSHPSASGGFSQKSSMDGTMGCSVSSKSTIHPASDSYWGTCMGGSPIPRCSMYGIFTYIWVIFGVNVGKYSIHGASGIWTSAGVSSASAGLSLIGRSSWERPSCRRPKISVSLGRGAFHASEEQAAHVGWTSRTNHRDKWNILTEDERSVVFLKASW